jgi:hypothetical protein
MRESDCVFVLECERAEGVSGGRQGSEVADSVIPPVVALHTPSSQAPFIQFNTSVL